MTFSKLAVPGKKQFGVQHNFPASKCKCSVRRCRGYSSIMKVSNMSGRPHSPPRKPALPKIPVQRQRKKEENASKKLQTDVATTTVKLSVQELAAHTNSVSRSKSLPDVDPKTLHIPQIYFSTSVGDKKDSLFASTSDFESLTSRTARSFLLTTFRPGSPLASLMSTDGMSETARRRSAEVFMRPYLIDIEKRALNNKPPPAYVSKLHELPPSSFSWTVSDGEGSTRRSYSVNTSRTNNAGSCSVSVMTDDVVSSRPFIDIIGCLQPPELILAKADHRCRKQIAALEFKVQQQKQHAQEVANAIVAKQEKLQRFLDMREIRERTSLWLVVIKLFLFHDVLTERFQFKKRELAATKRLLTAAHIIKTNIFCLARAVQAHRRAT